MTPGCIKKIRLLFILPGLILLCLPLALAEETKLDLQVHGGRLTADIEDAHLKAVIECLESSLDIWVRGGEPLYEEKISTEFSGLSIPDGIERLFYRLLNYSLLFDDSGHLLGVMLFKRPEKAYARPQRRSFQHTRYLPNFRRPPQR